MEADRPSEPLAFLEVESEDGRYQVAISEQLFIGRTCAGISEQRRLVVADPDVSRNHLEIHLVPVTDQAFIIDTSTNGTLLNGVHIDPALAVPIRPNDQIRIGSVALTFRSDRFHQVGPPTEVEAGLTTTKVTEQAMAMVAGDITNYSTISQATDHLVVAESLKILWQELGYILRAHRGILNHYAGDAIYAVWDVETILEGHELAIDFALAANKRVQELGPELPLRGPDGAPIQMGWGVTQGKAALAVMTRSVQAVIGDSTNVAFRLASLAGRAGRADVLVTSAIREAAGGHYVWGEAAQLEIKGRHGLETVFPVLARLP